MQIKKRKLNKVYNTSRTLKVFKNIEKYFITLSISFSYLKDKLQTKELAHD